MAKYSQEKVALEIARLDALKHISLELIRNPVVEIIGSYIVVEELQRAGRLNWLEATVLENLISGTVIAQQLAPLMPTFAEAGSKILGSLVPLVAGGV